jgi:hypothetical protein
MVLLRMTIDCSSSSYESAFACSFPPEQITYQSLRCAAHRDTRFKFALVNYLSDGIKGSNLNQSGVRFIAVGSENRGSSVQIATTQFTTYAGDEILQIASSGESGNLLSGVFAGTLLVGEDVRRDAGKSARNALRFTDQASWRKVLIIGE